MFLVCIKNSSWNNKIQSDIGRIVIESSIWTTTWLSTIIDLNCVDFSDGELYTTLGQLKDNSGRVLKQQQQQQQKTLSKEE